MRRAADGTPPAAPGSRGAVPAVARTSSAELDEMWRRQQVWWHSLFAALLLVVATLVVLDQGIASPALALLAALAGLYAVVGTRALAQCGPWWSLGYLLPAWALALGVMALTGGAGWLLAFALFPQVWAMLSRPFAVTMTVLGVSGTALVQAVTTNDADLGGVLVGAGISIAMSVVLGLFIDRLVREANSRAGVIDELRRTQAALAAAERAQGVSAERARLSREIHDTLAQGFTSVVTLARATSAAAERGDLDLVRERLGLIEATAADNLSEARLIVAELTPGHLQSRTLAEALDRLVEAVGRESGVAAELTVTGDPQALGANVEVVLLRAAQEALANVRRHAGARDCDVRLAYDRPDRVVLTVTDDGCGFDPDRRAVGYGLDGTAARAADVGGDAEVSSAPGAGTTVRVTVPR